MLWVEVPHGTLAASSALLFLAFGLSWFFAPPRTTTAATSPVPAPAPPAPAPAAPAPAPVAPVPHTAADAVAARPASTHPGARPAARTRNAPHGRRAAGAPVVTPAEPSRWTRTFGPPDTGQIPLQPYLSGVPASYATADNDLPDRRQRSHSSL
ncbi:hypothetical protein LOC60_05340 [Arthrobacter sp. zg-Y769]|nr:hypothetical protein [Arthrobacter sp. zg-Y769]